MIALGPIVLLIDGREVHGTVLAVRADGFDVRLGEPVAATTPRDAAPRVFTRAELDRRADLLEARDG